MPKRTGTGNAPDFSRLMTTLPDTADWPAHSEPALSGNGPSAMRSKEHDKRCRGAVAAAVCTAGFMVAGSSGIALSQQVCVTCEAPAATYACSIAEAERLKAAGRLDRWIRLACIKDIAHRYQHARCSVRNNASGCQGIAHIVRPEDAAQVVLQTRGSSPPGQTGTTPAQKPGNGEPRTMVELAQKTAKSTNDEIKKAGKTVSSAMEKTWQCLSSLFSKC